MSQNTTSAATAPRILDTTRLRNTTRYQLVFNYGTAHETRILPSAELRPRVYAKHVETSTPMQVRGPESSGAATPGPLTLYARRALMHVEWPEEGRPVLAALASNCAFVVDAAHAPTFYALQRSGFWGTTLWIAEGPLYNADGVQCLEAPDNIDDDSVRTLEMRVRLLVECI